MRTRHDQHATNDLTMSIQQPGVYHPEQGPSTSYQAVPTGGVGFANDDDDDDENAHEYKLEIVQHPVRARMCGFGDKDRRPLTPPLIVRVRAFAKPSGREIPADEIEIHFFVVQADLWSADRTREVNLVQHASTVKAGGEGGRLGGQDMAPEASTSYATTGGSGSYPTRGRSLSGGAGIDLQSLSMTAGPTSQQSPFQQQQPMQAGLPGPGASPWSSYHTSPQSLGGVGSAGSSTDTSPQEPGSSEFFQPQSMGAIGPSPGSAGSSTDPTFYGQAPVAGLGARLPPLSGLTTSPEVMSGNMLPPSAGSRASISRSGPISGAAISQGATYSPGSSRAGRPETARTISMSDDGGSTGTLTTKSTTTQSLVGNSHLNGHKLKDQNGELGIYFVFHDLSVRTEGIFRLRISFMVIGSNNVASTTSVPVQGQAFTEPFEVFSPKKFPGMKAATELSQCFASQGLRIPTRKGPSKRKRDKDDGDQEPAEEHMKEDDQDSDDGDELEEMEEGG